MCKIFILAALGLLLAAGHPVAARATVLQVGPDRAFATVQQAYNAAQSGDTIEIISGTYYKPAGWCVISKDNLTFRGVGPTRPVIDGGDGTLNLKGIYLVNSDNVTFENLEICNARVPDDFGANGAGIRGQGGKLTVRNCYIHDCDNGILSGTGGPQTFENCEFEHNGFGDGYSHNIYVGACDSFTMRFCYSHDAVVGHQVKTRAKRNYIYCNLISDDNGSGSYEIDIPQAGTDYIIGNAIYQGGTGNKTIITYGEEAPVNPDQHLYVLNNTIVNAVSGANFVVNRKSTLALVQNNIFQGPGTATIGQIVSLNNWATNNASLLNPASYDYRLTAASTGALNAGTLPDPATGIDGTSLVATLQYSAPCGCEARPADGSIDIGAFETGTANQPPVVDAGPDQVVEVPGTATLAGTVTDDGLGTAPGTLTTSWTLVGGPSGGTAALADPHALSTTATFTVSGVYEFQLTASDGVLSSIDYTTVAYDIPPVVTVSPDQVVATTTLPVEAYINGLIVDPDEVPAPQPVYSWSVISGPPGAVVTWANSRYPMVTFGAPGTYLVQLHAYDGALATDKNVTITVNQTSNSAPLVEAGTDQVIELPGSAQLAGSASDDGLPNPLQHLMHVWTTIDGPGTVTFQDSHSLVTSANFSVAGTYTLQLLASDTELTATDTVMIAVNPPPAVQVERAPGLRLRRPPGHSATTGIDPDLRPMTWLWTQTAGAPAAMSDATTPTATLTVPYIPSADDALLTFQATVSTDNGGRASETVTLQAYMAGDANHDNRVNIGDLQSLAAAWSSSTAGGNWNVNADFNDDGHINIGDLQLLVSNWNRSL